MASNRRGRRRPERGTEGDVYVDGGFQLLRATAWIFVFVRVGLRGEGVCDFDLKPQEGKQRPFHI